MLSILVLLLAIDCVLVESSLGRWGTSSSSTPPTSYSGKSGTSKRGNSLDSKSSADIELADLHVYSQSDNEDDNSESAPEVFHMHPSTSSEEGEEFERKHRTSYISSENARKNKDAKKMGLPVTSAPGSILDKISGLLGKGSQKKSKVHASADQKSEPLGDRYSEDEDPEKYSIEKLNLQRPVYEREISQVSSHHDSLVHEDDQDPEHSEHNNNSEW